MEKNNFVEKAIAVHGNKYDYSKVEYTNKRTKVCIICPVHGEFWQTPEKHLMGRGCPFCTKTIKSTKDKFIEKATAIHGDKYDYSKVEYVNDKTKLCIVCPEHGEFWQDPHNHLKGKGCPLCGKDKYKEKKYTTESFIEEAKRIHGDKYDYSKTVYTYIRDKVIITCPIHGDFVQAAFSHLQGTGCPKCAHAKLGKSKRKNTATFIQQAIDVQGDKYDYSKVNYKTAKEKVIITCPIHGDFLQSPGHHIQGYGCPKCVHPISSQQQEIADYLIALLGKNEVVINDRDVLKGKELDIYLPSFKTGIEFHGLYWHTFERTNNKYYHLDKLNLCKENNIKLLQIFEDEYVNNRQLVLDKIKHIIGKQDNCDKIMARKCTIKVIDNMLAENFLTINHIQGFSYSTIYLGAFYNDTLIGVMSFKKENKNNNNWELTRFATDNNYVCCGVGGKLFSYFVKNYMPTEVKSFADRRWTTNEDSNIYVQLGFKFDSYTKPDYRYYKPEDGIVRFHKFGFRKNTLNKKYGLPIDLTEDEMTEILGYSKIYDCGLIKYVWKA